MRCPEIIKTEKHAKAFVHYVYLELGLMWHPDESFANYEGSHDAAKLDALAEQMCAITGDQYLFTMAAANEVVPDCYP